MLSPWKCKEWQVGLGRDLLCTQCNESQYQNTESSRTVYILKGTLKKKIEVLEENIILRDLRVQSLVFPKGVTWL